MPIVRVEMWSGRTESQKAELARVITEAVVAIAHTTPEVTTVIFEDVAKRELGDRWSSRFSGLNP